MADPPRPVGEDGFEREPPSDDTDPTDIFFAGGDEE